jgi:hypothetical protein
MRTYAAGEVGANITTETTENMVQKHVFLTAVTRNTSGITGLVHTCAGQKWVDNEKFSKY